MGSKYPFILAHGIILKDSKIFKTFGRVENILKKAGYSVYTAKTDGFGTVETNAAQLKAEIERVLKKENAEKVNIIAHSKGGLDARYMVERLQAEDMVASLTTLCTPHKGSPIASKILRLPKFFVKPAAAIVNFVYRIFGDKKPDALTVCKQLQTVTDEDDRPLKVSEKVYCQSYSATLEKGRDDFIMSIPLLFSKKYEHELSDGVVSVESSKFGEYKGNCVDGSLSHSQAIGFMAGKKKEKIYLFYLQLCGELADKGF